MEIENKPFQTPRNHDIIFQKSEGCRTINVYPHPDHKPNVTSANEDTLIPFKKRTEKKPKEPLPVVNPEENPNIFVLKIKRRWKKGDKPGHNLDLEFKAPRPWKVEKPKLKDVQEEKPDDNDDDDDDGRSSTRTRKGEAETEAGENQSADESELSEKGEDGKSKKGEDAKSSKSVDVKSRKGDVDSKSKKSVTLEEGKPGDWRKKRPLSNGCPACVSKRPKCKYLDLG